MYEDKTLMADLHNHKHYIYLDIPLIKEQIASGRTQISIAKELQISSSRIWEVIHNGK
jgi:hypothetical protein